MRKRKFTREEMIEEFEVLASKMQNHSEKLLNWGFEVWIEENGLQGTEYDRKVYEREIDKHTELHNCYIDIADQIRYGVIFKG